MVPCRLCPLLALSVISLRRKIRSLSAQSRHCSGLARDGSVANDPKRTFAFPYSGQEGNFRLRL